MTKKMIFIAVFFFLAVNNASARGFINNPDRYPSVGISLGSTNVDGGLTSTLSVGSGLITRESKSEVKTSDFSVDLRLPVSHQLTLFGALSVIKKEMVFKESSIMTGENHDLGGFGFRIGARYYFNR